MSAPGFKEESEKELKESVKKIHANIDEDVKWKKEQLRRGKKEPDLHLPGLGIHLSSDWEHNKKMWEKGILPETIKRKKQEAEKMHRYTYGPKEHETSNWGNGKGNPKGDVK